MPSPAKSIEAGSGVEVQLPKLEPLVDVPSLAYPVQVPPREDGAMCDTAVAPVLFAARTSAIEFQSVLLVLVIVNVNALALLP
jgi:hypothetical protein